MDRNVRYDIARSISILWIVVVFHLSAYLGKTYNLNNNLACNELTWAALGCFSFISGLFIGKKSLSGIGEILLFYKKRLLRIYPLFFISAISLYLISYNGLTETVHGLLGISAFTGKQPLTLWYISMILFFYLISPPILDKKLKKRIIICVVYTMIFGVLFVKGCCDIRVVFNFLCYAMGICLSSSKYWWNSNGEKLFSNRWMDFAIVLLYLGILLFAGFLLRSPICKAAISLIGVAFVLAISFIIAKLSISVFDKILTHVAYSSMAVYLFHRLFYYYGLQILNPDSPMLKAIYMIFIVFPIGYYSSYFLQKSYDSLLKR